MTRPLYESQADRTNEQEVATDLFRYWRCTAAKLPIRYEVDYALCRNGQIMAWAEIKCRTTPRGLYPTYMVSLGKVLAGLELQKRTNLPFLLVVRWSDSLGWISGPTAREVTFGGRRDRADAADIEPMVHIPINQFALLWNNTP